MCANRQKEILHSGAMLVRPGGRLVYSTCTFAPQENEEVIYSFLKEHPDFTAEEAAVPWFTPSGMGMYRMWPHKLLGEGHFAAVLRRIGGSAHSAAEQTGEKLPKVWSAFAQEMGISLPAGMGVTFGNGLYWAPEGMPDLRGLKVERPGLELGVLKKERFEPSHALALWLQTCARVQDYGAESEQMKAYLHGDVVSSGQKGWCLVTADGFSIGWGKGDGTVLKNHYPKGLRR